MIDDDLRSNCDEMGAVMITPRNADGLHVRIDGSFQIDGGVADHVTFFRREPDGFSDEESSGGMGLVADAIALAEHFGKRDFRKHGGDHRHGEIVSFVGEDGQGIAGFLEFIEQVVDARIHLGAALPTEVVVLFEKRDEGIDVRCVRTRVGGALDEHAETVANKRADPGIRVTGQTVGSEGAVQGRGDAGQGVHEGAVEIKNETGLHAAKLAGSAAQGKRLKSDQGDQFVVAELVEVIDCGDERFRFRDFLDLGGALSIKSHRPGVCIRRRSDPSAD